VAKEATCVEAANVTPKHKGQLLKTAMQHTFQEF